MSRVAVPLRTLYSRARLAWWLTNWRDVWATYSTGRPVPPLRFRNGLVLLHGPGDDPMSLFWEVFSNAYYRAPLPRGAGIIVDVGANIGAATLYWAKRAPWARIHAYEPSASALEVLEANIRENGLQDRVAVFKEAVAAESGTLVLWSGLSSMQASTIAPPSLANPLDGGAAVPAVGFETVISRVADRKIALLKIDAEGVEVDILQRTPASCFAGVERVIVEYHDFLVPGARTQCVAALERLHYVCSVRPLKKGDAGYGLIRAARRT